MARKIKSTTVRYLTVREFDYLTEGREYDVTLREGSKYADVRRTDGSGIGTYLQMWQFKAALANGSLARVAA